MVGAFALSELGSSKERQDGALTLWRKTGSYLVECLTLLHKWMYKSSSIQWLSLCTSNESNFFFFLLSNLQVLVENGTMDGHSILMEARDTILKV